MGQRITYFKDYKAVTPYYLSVDESLERIKSGKIKDRIEHLRSIVDKKEAKKYKTTALPCILFAGEFSTREDKSLLIHSGYCILDFDHVDVDDYRYKLKGYPWIYAMFRSPSGDGLKVVAKIPPDKDKHRGYFRGIQKKLAWLPGFDPTSINVSRICFESYDPDLYVNNNAVEFQEYIEEVELIRPESVTAVVTNYEVLNRAVKKVLYAGDGMKHAELLKAAKLCGGWIQSGVVDEQDAITALEKAIQTKDIDDFPTAQKTIRDGIRYGKDNPIEDERMLPSSVGDMQTPTLEPDDHISTRIEEEAYMNAVRTQTLPMGLSTGFEEFDKHFRFKPGNFVIINGHDNVGKSTFIWYMAVLSNVLHKWKWILYCAENTEGQIRKSLMQFKVGKSLHHMNDVEYEHTLQWAYDNFTIIKSDEMLSWKQLLKIGIGINKAKHHEAFLIDPYNALDLDLKGSPLSSHEYHYMVTSQMRAFCKHWNTGIYLNCHAITEALRRTHKDGLYSGFPEPPNKADTEGGGKFSNRADEFLTIHRYVQHPSDYNLTQVHVRKVKETETGGRPTSKSDPIVFKMERGHFGFFDVDKGYNPLTDQVAKRVREEDKVQRLTFREEDDVFTDRGAAPF